MLGTNDLVRLIAQANPKADVTEDKVRRVLRRGLIPTIGRIAGRLVWSRSNVEALARILKLRMPPDEAFAPDHDEAAKPGTACARTGSGPETL